MADMANASVQLSSGRLSVEFQVRGLQEPVKSAAPEATLPELCRKALNQPLGFPELHRCTIPGDQVAIVVDPETPMLGELLLCVYEQLQLVADGGVTASLVLPPDPEGRSWEWLKESLPLHVQQQIKMVIHDPADRTQVSYVASSASGERIYLNRVVSEADLIITVGLIQVDRELGFRGTSSCLFPALSDKETHNLVLASLAAAKSTEESQTMRELVDEIGWLLGTQFTIQVIPGPKGPSVVLAGLPEEVFPAGCELVQTTWSVSLDEEVSSVITSIPGGPCAWKQFGQALQSASEVVEQGGRIIVVADIAAPEGPAATMLRRCQDPEELLKPLRREPTSDSVEISQLIEASRKARIYLRSDLPTELIEELGMFPLASEEELQRLVSPLEQPLVVPFANFAMCSVGA